MKKSNVNTIVNLVKKLTLVLLVSVFYNCDSDIDIDGDLTADVCESAVIFGLNTQDPYSGMLPLEKNANFGPSDEIAPGLGGFLTYSNASTYNYEAESYHFFNSSTKRFTNVTAIPPATFSTLSGFVAGNEYSHLVYVKGINKYYIVEYNLSDFFLREVNVNTGAILSGPIPSGITGVSILHSISLTTDNNNKVFLLVNKTLSTVNVASMTFLSSDVEALTTTYNLYGLEYSTTENKLKALRVHLYENDTQLVSISTSGILTIESSLNTDITDNNSIKNHFYSTTLNCDESKYIVSYREANIDTKVHFINLYSPEIITNTYEGNYYFGIESNSNN